MKSVEKEIPDDRQILREELRTEFLRRRRTNPSYSLRAFAQFLGIDQSLLSKILNQRRGISAELAQRLMAKLAIQPSVMAARSGRSTTRSSGHRYHNLEEDHYQLLENWSHFAVLELMKTKDFVPDPGWMARRLGLHRQEIKEVLERLERLGFIQRQGNQVELARPNNSWTENSFTLAARQRLQKKIAEMALASIESIPFEKRDHGSLTVAVKSSRLPQFKQKLWQIRRELDAFFQPEDDSNEFDEVYQISISFFPLTGQGVLK